MSKWESLIACFHRHAICIMLLLLMAMIALIVVVAGNDKELIGYFSFACSLSGILLALVVIFHTWLDSSDTRSILTDVKSHLTNIHRTTAQTEENLKKILLNEPSLKETKIVAVAEQGGSLPFNLSEVRLMVLKSLYCAKKASQNGQTLKLFDVVRKIYSDKSDEYVACMQFCFLGILFMLESFNFKIVLLDENVGDMSVSKMPKQMCEAVEIELDRRSKLESYKNKEKLIREKKVIDDFFATS